MVSSRSDRNQEYWKPVDEVEMKLWPQVLPAVLSTNIYCILKSKEFIHKLSVIKFTFTFTYLRISKNKNWTIISSIIWSSRS
jgi:hypothetical protein